jgi:hypothetical protein
LSKIKISVLVEPDLMIWIKAQAKNDNASISHTIRWFIYEAKARSDMRSMKP